MQFNSVLMAYMRMSPSNAHTDVFRWSRDLNFVLSFSLLPYFVNVSGEGPGESRLTRKLSRVFATHRSAKISCAGPCVLHLPFAAIAAPKF